MKKLRWLGPVAVLLTLALAVKAGIIIYNATLVSSTALAYDNTYTLDVQSLGISATSAQATYSTATVAAVTFTDGAASTGSVTIVDYTALTTAAATNSITVASNTADDLRGATIYLPGYSFVNGIDWATQSTTSGTAASIASALRTLPFLSVSTSGAVVYATATVKGSYYNSYSFGVSCSSMVLTVATPYFTGGQDNAILRINGVALQRGRDWGGASAAGTATSLAAAINANTTLNKIVKAQAIGAVVTTTSTMNGSARNYNLQSSTPTALSLSGTKMVTGGDPAFALGSSVFTTPTVNHLTTALPVLYTQGANPIGGLVDQTTYYAAPTVGNSFFLAKFSSSAVAGTSDLVVVTSTNSGTLLAQSSYTLTPLVITGTPGLSWTVSNDDVNWSSLQVSSVTISTTSAGASTFWSFGYVGARYLRLNVTGPTTGGINLSVKVIGTN